MDVKNIRIRAGRRAYDLIRNGGFGLDGIGTYFGPAGGPRWLTASGFDLTLLKEDVLGRLQPVSEATSSMVFPSRTYAVIIDAFLPEMDNGVYAVSKAGVVMASKVMARELAPYNIRVNTLAPGFVHTKLLDSSFEVRPGREEECRKSIPMGRIADPDDMVGTLIYLASDAAKYVTGHAVIVDGGLLYV